MNKKVKKKIFYISLLGENFVGKTSILNAFIYKRFNEEVLSNVGIDKFYIQKIFEKVEYKFKIFDTPGNEKYRKIQNITIQIADGYFMIFSVDNKKSFEKVIKLIDFIENDVLLEEKTLYLVGNKIDVKPERREVTKEEIEVFAKTKCIKYIETSARTEEGINEAFDEMFKDVYEKYKIYKMNNKNNESEPVKNHIVNKMYKVNKIKLLYELIKLYFSMIKYENHSDLSKYDNKQKINDHVEINKNDNKKNTNESFQINKNDYKKNANEHSKINNMNNKNKYN